jgi:pyruvate kinase
MDSDYTHAPTYNVPRRTRIICTIGPASESEEMIETLIRAGMNVARLNMSHSNNDKAKEQTERIRATCKKLNRNVGIMMDLQGPAIRTGVVKEPLQLKEGDHITLCINEDPEGENNCVWVNYPDLLNDISEGDIIVVDNGNLNLKAIKHTTGRMECEVLTDGVLSSRKHINLPGIHVNLPALTEKDIDNVKAGVAMGVDFFAMSFARQAKDIEQLREMIRSLGGRQKIIAKLEEHQGVRNLHDIIRVTDAIMIARGDLGIEMPYEDLPPLQRRIVKTCIILGCPVIVATHMLESMIENPAPTRAEVTDVSNAVYEQTDAIMLSGETSVGKYPEKCVRIMDRIARRIERSGGAGYARKAEQDTEEARMVRSAAALAVKVKARALVVFTRKGDIARYAAWARPLKTPVFTFTNDEILRRQLSIHWGCKHFLMDFGETSDETITRAIERLKEVNLVESGDLIVFVVEVEARGKMIDTIQLERLD